MMMNKMMNAAKDASWTVKKEIGKDAGTLSIGQASLNIAENDSRESILKKLSELIDKFSYTSVGEALSELYWEVA